MCSEYEHLLAWVNMVIWELNSQSLVLYFLKTVLLICWSIVSKYTISWKSLTSIPCSQVHTTAKLTIQDALGNCEIVSYNRKDLPGLITHDCFILIKLIIIDCQNLVLGWFWLMTRMGNGSLYIMKLLISGND